MSQAAEDARALAWQDEQLRRIAWQMNNWLVTLAGNEAAKQALIRRMNPPLRRIIINDPAE
jgi:hypothetical protein